jgi:hypothetical protein
MEYITFQVAEEVTKSSASSKIITYSSEYGTLTLSVPVEFIWFALSQDPKYKDSPQIDVKVPRLQSGTSTSYHYGEVTASVRIYVHELSSGEEASEEESPEEESPEEEASDYEETLYYIELRVAAMIGHGVVVEVFRSSGTMNVVEYLEMMNTFDIGTDLSISTRYFNDTLYSILEDSKGNFFQVADNRDLVNNTKNLIEYNAFVFDHQKLLSLEDAKKIMETGYLNFLFGK